MAQKFNWTREQVNKLTLRDVKRLTMNEQRVKAIGFMPVTKSSRRAFAKPVEMAVENLMAGRAWNVKAKGD